MKNAFMILTLITSMSCNSQAANRNEVDAILAEQINKNKTPSVQYYIFNKDSIIHKFIDGFADISNEKKTTKTTTYRAYSVTKTFTALAILQLAEQGKIDIEQPVITYLPEFPYPSEITIRQLLNHTSGIPNPIPLSWIHLSNEHNLFSDKTFFSQVFFENKKTKSKPNKKFTYSNLGYVVLGQLIAKVSGISYKEYISTNIIKALELEKGEMDFTVSDTNQSAVGYHKKYSFSNIVLGFMIDKSKFINRTKGKWNSFNDFYVNGASYGGLIGTSSAFVKYIQELLKPNCKLISDEYKKLLFTENFTSKGKPTGMCLSWFSGLLNGNQYYAHAGGGGGYYCEIRIYPDKEIGSVIMFNRTGMSDERFLDKLDKYSIKE